MIYATLLIVAILSAVVGSYLTPTQTWLVILLMLVLGALAWRQDRRS